MEPAPPGIDRRRFLRLVALGGLGLATAGCDQRSASSTASTTTPPPQSGPTATTGPASTVAASTTTAPPTTSAAPTALDELAGQLRGRLVRPADGNYAVAKQLFDPQFDAVNPAAVAYCASPDDVARCLETARRAGLPFAVRSGGHSYGGYSTTSGLVIDVTSMSGVSVNVRANQATIGAGARLIDVYAALNGQGVSIPAGSCPTVGLGGLTLGGGVGVVGRLHGLTCDALASLTLVTADGRTVEADATTNSDLYWACRGGGGGNFGVATSFTFTTFPTSEVALFGASWSWAAADELIPAWLSWIAGAPEPLWSNCILQTSQGAVPTLQVGGVWVGSAADLDAQLAKLVTAAGSPSGRVVGSNGFGQAMFIEAGCAALSLEACHVAGISPGGTLPRAPVVAKSGYMRSVPSPAGVHTLLDGLNQRRAQGLQGAVALDSYGGAINRVGPADTAFVHRDAIAGLQFSAQLPVGTTAAQAAQSQSWLAGWYGAMAPWLDGEAYQNYVDPTLRGWAEAYYGANLARLQQVKATWDPDDAFRFAQSIPQPGT
jgi:hypothetical protein